MNSSNKFRHGSRAIAACGFFLALTACNRFVAPLPQTQNANDNWLMAGVNPARTSHHENEVQLPLAEVARLKLSSAVAQNIFVHNGVLFAPTLDGRLFTIDLATYRFHSKKKMPSGQAGTLAMTNERMVVALRYGKETLVHYDLAKRDKLWEIDAGDIASEPLLTDSLVYVAAISEHVDAYALATGAKRWTFRTVGQLHASPALSGEVLIAATNRGKVYGLNASTGKLIWEVDLDQPLLSTPVIAGAHVYIGGSRDLIAAFNLQTGEQHWRYKSEGRIFNAPAVNDSLVIFGASDGLMRALRRGNGTVAWTFRAGSGIGTSPMIAGSKVFFGSLDKNIYGVNVNTGALLWQWSLEGRVRTNPIVWQDRLIVASEDRYLYVFGPQEKLGAN